MQFNKELEQRFEDAVNEKEIQVYSVIAEKTEQKFAEFLESKSSSLDEETKNAEQLNKFLNKQKDAFHKLETKQLSKLEKITNLRIKKLEEEAEKYHSRITTLNTVLKRVESTLKDVEDIKKLKLQFSKDQKTLTQGIIKYTKAKENIANMRKNIDIEGKEILEYHKKFSIYELVDRCMLALRFKEMDKVKQLYQEIATLYRKGTYNDEEKTELYKYIMLIYEEIETHNKAMNETVQ
jgi:hypothetical protein